MFNNFTYKQKFLALVVLAILLGFTAYKRSFRLTIDAYRNYKGAAEKLRKINNSWQRAKSVENEVDYLDNLIGRKAMDADIVQQEILTKLSEIENSMELVKLERVHKANNEYFNIYTNQLVLSGRFDQLLRGTYSFEKDFEFSRLVCLNFYSEKELRTRRLKLYARLIFQNYEKIP